MGIRKDKRRQDVVSSLYLNGDHVTNPTDLMAVAIVIQAIEDWRSLIKQKAWHDKCQQTEYSFAGLRNFFKGDWCAFLMLDFELEPERILEHLEIELQSAMRKERTDNERGKDICCR
jgi:hypothetical protein